MSARSTSAGRRALGVRRPFNRRFAPAIVAAALVVLGLWLAIAAAGGGTDANAGYLQFYPGQLCRFAPAKEAGGPGCPRVPGRGAAQQQP